ncbi:MAG TPA: ABC transporter substrate-binding protein [Phototrophicaceae bacterium]|nr:ABC transporter substrate-binding protein [Phototrophicaceae bacterium]
MASTLKSTTFRHIAFFVTIIALFLTIGAASAQDATATVEAGSGGTLRVALNTPSSTLDPALQSDDSEIALNHAIYDYLVDVMPDSTIAPNLATSWTVSDDGLTYTFTLATGVKFQDGSDFSSADVVWTFNRLVKQSSQALNLLGDFKISAPDANTVVFTLTQANADFLYGVGARQADILKNGQDTPDVIGSDGSLTNFNGTGPFILKSLDTAPGGRAVLTANPNYWKAGEPKLAELDFSYIDDQQAQVDALQSGQADFVFRIPTTIYDSLNGKSGITLLNSPSDLHAVIRVRADKGSIGEDVRVRQALKYATDRDALNQQVADGNGVVGNNDPISPVFAQYYDNTIQTQAPDSQKACDLLTQAGKNPLDISLYYPEKTLDFDDLAVALQQQWNATGCINLTLQPLTAQLYYDNTQANNWLDAQVAMTNWSAQPSPQSELEQAFTTSGAYNESHWSNADLDKLIQQASQTSDAAARKAIYSQIAAIFADQGPIIIPYFEPLYGATSANVSGLTMAPFPGLTDFRTVTVGG